jgi:hypothetical protein
MDMVGKNKSVLANGLAATRVQGALTGINRTAYVPNHIHISTEDEDRDGLRNVRFVAVQPLDPADSPRELPYTQSPRK